MRCHYLSDLHLETQDCHWKLPAGDVLIIAGDLCHACRLDPTKVDKYSIDQRARVERFIDAARRNFAHVVLIAGNHEHYDGVFEETHPLLMRHLPGVVVLDDSHIDIGGIRFYGTTLWSDFEGRSSVSMNAVRRRMGEYFFVKTRRRSADGNNTLAKFQPENAAAAFDRSWLALQESIATETRKPTVVISHHAPSLQGLNPMHRGNGLEGAYASDLDATIATFANVPFWVHGHTHIKRTYRIGATKVVSNCRGFEKNDSVARNFSPAAHFDL